MVALVEKVFGCIYKDVKRDYQVNNLSQASLNTEYKIKKIETVKEDLREFLFTLGCYKGEKVTVISVLSENYVIVLKDARYSIDQELAKVIII